MKAKKIFLTSLLFLVISLNRAEAEETLTWGDCIKEAAKNHPDLISAEENINQQKAGKAVTASGLYPQIDSSLDASTAKTGSTTADTYSYGASGTQLVFDGFKTINNVKAALKNIEAAKQNFRFTSSTVRFRLRSAFISLLKAQELLRITEEIYNIRKGNLDLIALRYESGLEHKGALLTAEANSAEAKYEISQAKRNVEAVQRQLEKEMGRKQLTAVTVKGDFDVKDAAKEKPDFEALAKNNPSLQKLIAQKNAAEFSLQAAYANFSPSISGRAGANKSGAEWPPQAEEWNMGVALSLPVFEGGLRFAQAAQAKASLNQFKASERSTKDGVLLILEQDWAALQDALENVEVQKKFLNAAEERSKIAQAQYSTGFIAFDNWTIIEDNLVKAKKAFLDAQANALAAEAEWVQAKGETLEYEQ